MCVVNIRSWERVWCGLLRTFMQQLVRIQIMRHLGPIFNRSIRYFAPEQWWGRLSFDTGLATIDFLQYHLYLPRHKRRRLGHLEHLNPIEMALRHACYLCVANPWTFLSSACSQNADINGLFSCLPLHLLVG